VSEGGFPMKKNAGKEMNSFRTSIGWSKIFPNGDDEQPNEKGLQFYDNLFDELLKHGMEPMVTISHYEMPLNIPIKHNGWHNRKTIHMFEKYCEVIFERYKGKVKYWILINQTNLISHESFNHLGIFSDQFKNLEEAKWQGIHNELVACGRAIKIGKKINPDFQIGMMSYYENPYLEKGSSADMLAALKHTQMQFFYSDIQVRGKYPNYAFRYFEDHKINIEMTVQDIEDLKNTVDFVSFSYYYTMNISGETDELLQNSHITEANDWGWGIDPVGLRVALNEYYDRYQLPIMVTGNGMGFYESLDENNTIQDDYRIKFLRQHIIQIKEAIHGGVDATRYLSLETNRLSKMFFV
jgi:6-phospho-beta-glucosidase